MAPAVGANAPKGGYTLESHARSLFSSAPTYTGGKPQVYDPIAAMKGSSSTRYNPMGEMFTRGYSGSGTYGHKSQENSYSLHGNAPYRKCGCCGGYGLQ